ncbi:hypothetical protein [Nocardia colli]|uniref:hypothetical protein n=1 Tax=Nocardia colli TaxID=2545717 RepID=UPI0035D52FB6
MLISSRVLVRAMLAVGIGLLIPAPTTAFAELPTAPKLCSAEQERAAEAKPDPVAVEACANLRIQSAEARRSSVPVEEDPETITPFNMKSDIGVSPETRKRLFGEGDSATGSTSAYEQTATRAYYFTGFFTAQQGGALYVPPAAVESAEESHSGLDAYLAKKAGGADGKSHDDKNLTASLLAAKKTAHVAAVRAILLAGGNPRLPEASDDAEADDQAAAEFGSIDPGDTVENRIAANEAEQAAVAAAIAAGWLDKAKS